MTPLGTGIFISGKEVVAGMTLADTLTDFVFQVEWKHAAFIMVQTNSRYSIKTTIVIYNNYPKASESQPRFEDRYRIVEK